MSLGDNCGSVLIHGVNVVESIRNLQQECADLRAACVDLQNMLHHVMALPGMPDAKEAQIRFEGQAATGLAVDMPAAKATRFVEDMQPKKEQTQIEEQAATPVIYEMKFSGGSVVLGI